MKLIKLIFCFVIIIAVSCSNEKNNSVNDKDDTISFDVNYYIEQHKLFSNEQIENEDEIVKLIDNYFYKPEEIKKSKNYKIIRDLLSELKIISKENLIFINEEILKTDRGELDTNFCECSILYTRMDTTSIVFSCYKFGKIYSIMPLWDGNKEMKITWLR